jgi:hypothetical protein
MKRLIDLIARLFRPADDPCPRCSGDHDRIDRREPCPVEQSEELLAYIGETLDIIVGHADTTGHPERNWAARR